nr:hypothetical protein Iba_chr10eCG12580 [Ipomoea batatas]
MRLFIVRSRSGTQWQPNDHYSADCFNLMTTIAQIASAPFATSCCAPAGNRTRVCTVARKKGGHCPVVETAENVVKAAQQPAKKQLAWNPHARSPVTPPRSPLRPSLPYPHPDHHRTVLEKHQAAIHLNQPTQPASPHFRTLQSSKNPEQSDALSVGALHRSRRDWSPPVCARELLEPPQATVAGHPPRQRPELCPLEFPKTPEEQ